MSNTVPLFLSAEKAAALAACVYNEPSVVSAHLPVDGPGGPPEAFDRLARAARRQDPAMRRLAKDMDEISRFIRDDFLAGSRRGLCVYSSVEQGLFEVFATPEPFSSSLRAGPRPDLSPLNSMRSRYWRFLGLQLGPQSARFVEIHLGEAWVLEEISGASAASALSDLAIRASALRRERGADRLVVGASPELLAGLEALLEPELLDTLIFESGFGPDRPLEDFVEQIRVSERAAQRLRESVVVHRFLEDLRASRAVCGLDRVAAALATGGVIRVLVRDGWAKMGRCCPKCSRLSVDHRSCPWCFRATEPVIDLVAELCARAASAGAEVFRVVQDPRFAAVDRIGAQLADAAPGGKPPVPTGRALRGLYATKQNRGY